MRLEHVRLTAFRRFVDASFYVNRKRVALVGPNEAGKSSVLAALQLFDNEAPVALSDLPRTETGLSAETPVASLTLRLEKDDLAVLRSLPLESYPSTVTMLKLAGGEIRWQLSPMPELRLNIRHRAAGALKYVKGAARTLADAVEPEDLAFRQILTELSTAIDRVESTFLEPNDFSAQEWSYVWAAHDRLQNSKALTDAESSGWAALQSYFEQIHQLGSFRPRIRLLLAPRVPEIVSFDRDLRLIRDDYDLDAIASGTEPLDKPLDYLLRFGGTSVEDLLSTIDDRPRQKNALRLVNKQLKSNFRLRWKQSDAFAKLDIENHRLFVYVEDSGTEFLAKFSERSDGLRTFIALACFLGVTQREVEPIVLIDEAICIFTLMLKPTSFACCSRSKE